MLQTEQADNGVLTTLFHHNTWANLKLLDFCEALGDEQLDTSATGTYGSVRDTLHHIVGAEVGYVRRVNGKLPAEEAVEKVHLAVYYVPQRRDDRAIGARHGGVQGLLVKPSAELQDLRGGPGIVPDRIVQRVSHLDPPTAGQPTPLASGYGP